MSEWCFQREEGIMNLWNNPPCNCSFQVGLRITFDFAISNCDKYDGLYRKQEKCSKMHIQSCTALPTPGQMSKKYPLLCHTKQNKINLSMKVIDPL